MLFYYCQQIIVRCKSFTLQCFKADGRQQEGQLACRMSNSISYQKINLMDLAQSIAISEKKQLMLSFVQPISLIWPNI